MRLYKYYKDDFPISRMEIIVCADNKVDAVQAVVDYLTNSKEYDIMYFLEEGIEQYISDYVPGNPQVLADISWANDLKGHFDN